ncbi:HNH endonuclease [Corynebacterium bovis]|uniref:HNH endonuclease signature motif containing protein n=2 Tax=Corynebacterium bovis TaxID=36808 RepID=UPI0031389202
MGSTHDLRAAVAAMESAAAIVAGTGEEVWGRLGEDERVELYARLERARKSLALADAAFLLAHAPCMPAGVHRRPAWLARRFRLTSRDARQRVKAVRRLDDRPVGPEGRPAATAMPEVRGVVAEGLLDTEGVEKIDRAITALPASAQNRMAAVADGPIARVVRDHGPDALDDLAPMLRALLGQDDPYTREDRARMRRLTLSKQGPDGMSSLRGLVTPRCAAALAKLFADHAGTGDLLEEGEKDLRSAEQRRHDALEAAVHGGFGVDLDAPDTAGQGRSGGVTGGSSGDGGAGEGGHGDGGQGAHGSGDGERDSGDGPDSLQIPRLRGRGLAPRRRTTTIVAVTTLKDLLARQGTAMTDTGVQLPLADLVEDALCRDTYLHVLGLRGETLYLGRSSRLGSTAQYLALLGEEGMSMAPGSATCAARCHIHHIDSWESGGLTDIDNLTLVDPLTHAKIDDSRTDPSRWWTVRADARNRERSGPGGGPGASGAGRGRGGAGGAYAGGGGGNCPGRRERVDKAVWIPPVQVDPEREPRVNGHPSAWANPGRSVRRARQDEDGIRGDHGRFTDEH